jgi:hypothetical protein
LTRKSLQPIVCCLGDDVGGNPTQFALERAFADRGLSDWKLFSAEISNEDIGKALSALDLLGIESALLLTDGLRRSVVADSSPVLAQPLAKWCGRATLLRRLPENSTSPEKLPEKATDKTLEKTTDKTPDQAEHTSGTAAVPAPLTWEATYSVGSAMLQSILAAGRTPASSSHNATAAGAGYSDNSSGPREGSGAGSEGLHGAATVFHCIVLGDSPTARAVVAALVSFESSHIWWRVAESSAPLSDHCPLELSEVLQGAIGAERLKICAEMPDDTGIIYDTIVFADERWQRDLEKWLAREQSSNVRRMVDARSDVFSLAPPKLPTADTIQIIRQTDWLGKILEEDFLRLTGVAPNSAIVRDALDEYLEL